MRCLGAQDSIHFVATSALQSADRSELPVGNYMDGRRRAGALSSHGPETVPPCDGPSRLFETFSLCAGDCLFIINSRPRTRLRVKLLAWGREADPMVDGTSQYLLLDRRGLVVAWSTKASPAASIRCTLSDRDRIYASSTGEPHRSGPLPPPTGALAATVAAHAVAQTIV